MTGVDPTVRPRAIHLLEYLKAVRDLKEQSVRDVADYWDERWWAGDVPDHPSCRVTSTGDEAWLRVSKTHIPAPPAAPQEILPYLRTRVDDPWHAPAFGPGFRDRFPDESEDADELEAALRFYADGAWSSWAERARPAAQARELYDKLFELRQRLQRDSALIELVWGHGILSWVTNETRIVHPVVTSQVQLSFDAETGTISVEPEAFVPHRMEIDMLQSLRLPGFDLLVKAQEEFRVFPVGPFDPEAGLLYEKLAAALGQDGQVVETTVPRPAGPVPTITASWVLMVRRRSTMYKRFFTSLHDALVDGDMQVPAPLVAVVADEPGKLDRDVLASDDETRGQAAERLLMPLPTNPEQEEVARRLASHRGVTVQGPPGTGKTHTIANLISHLVGHGKRVLVTSQKEQALSVLRDKIPESIRDLSVAVLGSSTSSLAQLDQSVQAIYERAVGLDRVPARRRIKDLDERLTQTQREIGALRNRIEASLSRERDSYSLGGATYSPSDLGKWLADGEDELGYIPDELARDTACPLTTAEFADIFRIAREIGKADRVEARLTLPMAQQLPTPSELASITAELSDVRDRIAGTESAVQDRVALERLTPDELAALIESVAQAAELLRQMEEPWLATIRGELRNTSFAATWRDQVKAVREGIEELAAYRNRLLGHRVELPGGELPSKELLEQLGQIRDRLAAGKGISKTFQRELYRVREACLVDEEPPRHAEDVELCIMKARSRRRRYELIRRWNDAISRVGGPLVDVTASYPEYEVAGWVDRLDGAFGWEEGGWEDLRDRLRAAGTRAPLAPSSSELAGLAETLGVAALHVREKELAGRLDAVRTILGDCKALSDASYLWGELLDAFTDRAWERWGRTVDEVRRVSGLVSDVSRFDDLIRRLAGVAPTWTRRIAYSDGVSGSAGESIGRAETAPRAWEWRQADTWLRAIMSADDPATLQRQLESLLRDESRLTADLAAESAWLGLAERLTDQERRALDGWVAALRKVGKGTGKYAAHWRAEAQQQMRDAQAAVPVWIMPAHRVVESFDATTARFDVVIVDESSQCDLFGLSALALADKAVIVGDDKQISPSAVGTEESAVHELIRQFIPDVPQSGLLDIKSSLYDMAKMRFPGVIMLREHFRCLPEIISFSNQLCYNGKILPLREQALDPSWRPVVDVFLEDGFRDRGADTNEAEAAFIVDKIASLCADPAYEGKTFGVISLIGDAQAALIESRLVARLGEKEMERRTIRCGNAYHFQGDERDVMFLSLVAAGGEGRRIGAMTKEADRQRINVAASRARDQMWCVRSVTLDELHPDDVRSVLIRHCQNPSLVASSAEEARFDSEFERSVYQRIVARGYRVKTQYRVGRYRIDQVIEGAGAGGRRLALELDGDAYHGPDRFKEDRERQAILERLGWTFHRIRGSAYYRNPDSALEPLWERLESLGIQPRGEEPEVSGPLPVERTTDSSVIRSEPVADLDLDLEDDEPVDDDYDEFDDHLPVPRADEPAARPDDGRDPALNPRLAPGLPVQEYTGQQLTRLARWIRSDGVARTDKELLGEMMLIVGRQRLRREMRKRLIAALDRTRPQDEPGTEPAASGARDQTDERPAPARVEPDPDPSERPAISGNGLFVVGADIEPGMYVVPGAEKEGAGFTLLASRDIRDAIKFYRVQGPITVTIGPGVEAVHVRGCLPWRRVEGNRTSAIMNEASLHQRFQQHVLGDINNLRARGYNPTRFLGLVRQRGSAVSAARFLFADPRHTSYGFERLWEMDELERSVEFAASLPWFTSLFTADELDEAKSRLILHDFPFEERLARAAAHPPVWLE